VEAALSEKEAAAATVAEGAIILVDVPQASATGREAAVSATASAAAAVVTALLSIWMLFGSVAPSSLSWNASCSL